MSKTDDKYWADYSNFIEMAENITGLTPENLLERYKELISELADGDEEYYLEWKYELDYDVYIREKIQYILDNPIISENQLLKAFREKVMILDGKFKKYIENDEDLNWWKNPKIKFQK